MKSKPDFKKLRERLVEDLVDEGIIKSGRVREAFLRVPREEFVWPYMQNQAYVDTPLPLGNTGQTISAPHMVAIMLEELYAEPGMKVLEIGAGSGYNAALMAEIVGPPGSSPQGSVTTMERVEQLVTFAEENLRRTGYLDRVTVVYGDGTLGYPERSEEERYERIIVTAASPHIPRYLTLQLKPGGILLIPVGDTWGQTLTRVHKQEGGSLRIERLCGCIFVPLVGEDGYR